MLLWLLAALSALLGLLLLALGLIGVIGAATPNMQGFNPGQSVVISDGGMSVYSRSDARAETVCTGDGPDGQAVFERPVQEYAVDVSGTDFYEIARSPQDLSAGTYAMTCNGTGDAVYAGPWAPDTTSGGLLGPVGIVSGLLLLGLALALAVAAMVARRRGKRDGAAHPYQQGGQPGWQGSGGYSSPYATPAQPGPAYGSPPPAEHSPQQSGYPYGAPPPPPPGSGYAYGQPSLSPQPPAYGPPQSYGPAPSDGDPRSGQPPAYAQTADSTDSPAGQEQDNPVRSDEQSEPDPQRGADGADTESTDGWQQDTTSAPDDEQRWPPPPPR